MAAARFTSFLVKIASRCNLDCDYCYVYHHADQSWRGLPKVLSPPNQQLFAGRLAEYAAEVGLRECFVVIHGGEPLLAGVEAIVGFVDRIRRAVSPETKVDFGLQTNGLLLTDEALDGLEQAGVAVSLSLDGPREANDLHRVSRKGRSSFDRVAHALERLKARPSIFAGIIAVIDPRISPATLLSYFDQHQPPRLDFLLPDAHHERPPPGRNENPDIYLDWLVEAFDLWLEQYPHLPIRFFESLLDAAAGLPSSTDALGFGDVSLVTIETDGTYHDLDVLKVVGDGATRLHGSLADTPVSAVASSPAIEAHRRRLSLDGLCPTCRSCPVADICGGGSVPHRHGPNGFDHPSIYCRELFGLISHAKQRLAAMLEESSGLPESRLPDDFSFERFELAEAAPAVMDLLCEDAELFHVSAFRDALERVGNGAPPRAAAKRLAALPTAQLAQYANWPGAVAWTNASAAVNAGRVVHDVDGNPVRVDDGYVEVLGQSNAPSFGCRPTQSDLWLRAPFGQSIYFEDEAIADQVVPLIHQALEIVRAWRPALHAEIQRACRSIVLVRDPSAHPEKIVSFSDNSVPGALYVSVVQGDHFIDPYDLADSLIHEHRHQKLYLLERFAPMVQSSSDLVVSPWREDLRPASGLLHAVFVFVELRRFWQHVLANGPERVRARAFNQLQDTDRHLDEAFQTLASCPLSKAGQALANVLNAARIAPWSAVVAQ